MILSASTIVKSNKTLGPIACIYKQYDENKPALTLLDILSMKRSSRQLVFIINKNGGIVGHEEFSKEKIDQFLKEDDIGLIFSKSGNIFLIKENCINFILRSNNFYTFRQNDFIHSIKSNKSTNKINEKVLNTIYFCMLKSMIYCKEKIIKIIKCDDNSDFNIDRMSNEEINELFCEKEKYTINENGYLVEEQDNQFELLKIMTKRTGELKVFVCGTLKYQLK